MDTVVSRIFDFCFLFKVLFLIKHKFVDKTYSVILIRILVLVCTAYSLLGHVLLINQMGGLLDQIQQRRYIPRPRTERTLGTLRLQKPYDILGTIDLGVDTAVAHHARNLLLELSQFQPEHIGEPRAVDALVIGRGDTDIVLYHAFVELVVPVGGQLGSAL